VLRICQRNGWTLATWNALDPAERDTWLAYDMHQQNELNAVLETMADEKKLTPDGWINSFLKGRF
jgi:hypothetical protein